MPAKKKTNVVGLTGVTIAFATLAWAIFVWWSTTETMPEEYIVLVVDGRGAPVPVVIVGPDGQRLPSDDAGYTVVPGTWRSKGMSIRVPETLWEIRETVLSPDTSGKMRIVLEETKSREDKSGP